MDFDLNNLSSLICHKRKQTNLVNQYIIIIIILLRVSHTSIN